MGREDIDLSVLATPNLQVRAAVVVVVVVCGWCVGEGGQRRACAAVLMRVLVLVLRVCWPAMQAFANFSDLDPDFFTELQLTRPGTLLHAKYMMMMDQSRLVRWVYAGSHNFSQNAWGRTMALRKGCGQGFEATQIGSFEAGVVAIGAAAQRGQHPIVPSASRSEDLRGVEGHSRNAAGDDDTSLDARGRTPLGKAIAASEYVRELSGPYHREAIKSEMRGPDVDGDGSPACATVYRQIEQECDQSHGMCAVLLHSTAQNTPGLARKIAELQLHRHADATWIGYDVHKTLDAGRLARMAAARPELGLLEKELPFLLLYSSLGGALTAAGSGNRNRGKLKKRIAPLLQPFAAFSGASLVSDLHAQRRGAPRDYMFTGAGSRTEVDLRVVAETARVSAQLRLKDLAEEAAARDRETAVFFDAVADQKLLCFDMVRLWRSLLVWLAPRVPRHDRFGLAGRLAG